ncbi:MAG: cell wall hydrolase [Clostridia bacterium]|nr:cell wall hydrolase [Clostridia bacterium]
MNDHELIARLIKCEAEGEGDVGQRAVATVIMNRVRIREGEYGRYNTPRDVIFAENQFECVSGARNIYTVSPEQRHYEIAEWAINGGRLGGVDDALWFFNPFSDVCPDRFSNQSGFFYARIGEHCFYAPTSQYYST